MYQSFDPPPPGTGMERIDRLRAAMAEAGLDAVLVPRADAHQGEYVADADARLAWLTGFTGSAGIAAITADRAALFADGRYTVQAREQAPEGVEIVDFPATRPGAWLAEVLNDGAKVGFDPWTHTPAEIDALKEALGPGIGATATDNLIDAIWQDRPARPTGAVWRHPEALAGATAAEKRERIAGTLREAGQAWAVITLPDSIAWLLNIRGSDLPHVPVAQAFALIEAKTARVRLFIDADKLGDLALAGVDILPQDSLLQAVSNLSGPVRLDRDTVPMAVADALTEAGVKVEWGRDPCLIPKATKTEAELEGAREAHLRDGAAMCRFLHWLDTQLDAGETLTEIDAARALEGFRRDTGALKDISFDTISAAGPHAALPHYRVTTASDRALAPGELYLVDSGGQYEDGTTDITRTLAVGTPPEEAVAAFTRVLKGMIGISRLRWPEGLAGRDLDAVARSALWHAGQDYGHGTGHGIGSYLSVHEGPQSLSQRGTVPFEPGMILSNEPGYYREGHWGIRIENLLVVERTRIDGGDPGRDFLGFETLTWVPIDRRMIDTAALTAEERAWIDAYHRSVADRMTGRVPPEVAAWLETATAPLA